MAADLEFPNLKTLCVSFQTNGHPLADRVRVVIESYFYTVVLIKVQYPIWNIAKIYIIFVFNKYLS